MIQLIAIASATASAAAVEKEKRIISQGLPAIKNEFLGKKPDTNDRFAEFMIMVFILAPGIIFAGVLGLMLFTAIKVAFAVQGYSFP